MNYCLPFAIRTRMPPAPLSPLSPFPLPLPAPFGLRYVGNSLTKWMKSCSWQRTDGLYCTSYWHGNVNVAPPPASLVVAYWCMKYRVVCLPTKTATTIAATTTITIAFPLHLLKWNLIPFCNANFRFRISLNIRYSNLCANNYGQQMHLGLSITSYKILVALASPLLKHSPLRSSVDFSCI